ncbi:3-hydroxyisobutyryl-CoA hydrolase 1 [Asimina triloba]
MRTLTLNRPKNLNALTIQMVDRLLKRFLAYEKDPNVKLVILKARGPAFCAGGDAAAVAHFMTSGKRAYATKFYTTQQKMDYVMATFKKAQVSLINVIVMGGGAGASMHGKFRVVTENAVFAMPETSLGLCPDVGASHFLSRLPGSFGEYLGLTGARLDAAELVACGLATHFNLPLLEEALKTVDSSDPAAISAVIDDFALRPRLKDDSPYRRWAISQQLDSQREMDRTPNASMTLIFLLDIINKCFSKGTVEEILAALIRIGRTQDIGQCLIREYRMISHAATRTISNDFYEWGPAKLELVTREMVANHFAVVDDEEWEELQLAIRSDGLPTPIRAKL